MTTPACLDNPDIVCRWDDDKNDCPCMQPEPVPTVETVPTGDYL